MAPYSCRIRFVNLRCWSLKQYFRTEDLDISFQKQGMARNILYFSPNLIHSRVSFLSSILLRMCSAVQLQDYFWQLYRAHLSLIVQPTNAQSSVDTWHAQPQHQHDCIYGHNVNNFTTHKTNVLTVCL